MIAWPSLLGYKHTQRGVGVLLAELRIGIAAPILLGLAWEVKLGAVGLSGG